MFEDPVRLAAIAAVVGVFVWPHLGTIQRHVMSMLAAVRPFPLPKTGIDAQDLATILDLAARLKTDGNDKAAKLAKQLLDAVLEAPPQ